MCDFKLADFLSIFVYFCSFNGVSPRAKVEPLRLVNRGTALDHQTEPSTAQTLSPLEDKHY